MNQANLKQPYDWLSTLKLQEAHMWGLPWKKIELGPCKNICIVQVRAWKLPSAYLTAYYWKKDIHTLIVGAKQNFFQVSVRRGDYPSKYVPNLMQL